MHGIKHTMQEWSANASGVEACPSTGEPPVWSHRCGWEELAVPFAVDSAARAGLDLGSGWVNRWSVVWRSGGVEVTCLLRDLAEIPVAGCEPGKRLLASVWVWTSITHGDHIYAPAVRPVLVGRRPGGWLGHYIHHRWRFMAAGRDGHYEALRERLDPYANKLAARIDAGLACPAGGPCGESAFVNL